MRLKYFTPVTGHQSLYEISATVRELYESLYPWLVTGVFFQMDKTVFLYLVINLSIFAGDTEHFFSQINPWLPSFGQTHTHSYIITMCNNTPIYLFSYLTSSSSSCNEPYMYPTLSIYLLSMHLHSDQSIKYVSIDLDAKRNIVYVIYACMYIFIQFIYIVLYN